MKRGIIHGHINSFNPQMVHDGLDIVISAKASTKPHHQLELGDFELINRGQIMPHSEFSTGPVADLYDKVIHKYFEQPKIAEIKAEIEAADKETTTVPVNGKVIKAIRKNGNEHEILTYEESPSEEMSKLVNEILRVKGIADMKMQEQMIYCANKLRIGTLDMPKGQNQIHVHVENGTQPVTTKVTRKQIIATLWFISKMYMLAPSFRKFLTVTIQDGKYTVGYKNGEPYFDTNGLSQLELDIIKDLSTIKES